jgi:predicted transcriptional regulator
LGGASIVAERLCDNDAGWGAADGAGAVDFFPDVRGDGAEDESVRVAGVETVIGRLSSEVSRILRSGGTSPRNSVPRLRVSNSRDRAGRDKPPGQELDRSVRSYFSNMQVQLTPEEETRLAELAARDGRTTGDLVQEAVKRYIEDDPKFIAAVIKGLASLDRGEFISHEAVGKRIDRLFSG